MHFEIIPQFNSAYLQTNISTSINVYGDRSITTCIFEILESVAYQENGGERGVMSHNINVLRWSLKVESAKRTYVK